jgi:hypothetical protein
VQTELYRVLAAHDRNIANGADQAVLQLGNHGRLWWSERRRLDEFAVNELDARVRRRDADLRHAVVVYGLVQNTVVPRDAQRQSRIAVSAKRLSATAQAQQDGQSRRAAAGAAVARSRLRHWRAPKALSPPPALTAFAETPKGLQWLRQIPVAAHGRTSELGGAGIRMVGEFPALSGPSAFLATASRTQQALPAEPERQIPACAGAHRAPREGRCGEDGCSRPQANTASG